MTIYEKQRVECFGMIFTEYGYEADMPNDEELLAIQETQLEISDSENES